MTDDRTEQLVDELRRRIAYPTTVLPRRDEETVERWAARAVAAGLADGSLPLVSAEDLAIARQTIAHSGTGYIPPWHGLDEYERAMATLEASNWLKALRCAIQAAAAVDPA